MATVTIKEIAKICGVSEGTVDRAINNRTGISDATKKRIMEVVRKENYKPDRIAQSLAKGKTMSIGLVCFDLYNNFIANLVDTIESVAKENDYFINLVLSHGDKESERKGIEYLAERRVDGIIIFPVGYGEEYVNYLKGLHIPVVSIYNRISDTIPFVGMDARAAMKSAVEHIVEKHYEQIILINSSISYKMEQNINVDTLLERQKGYLEGIKNANVNPDGPAIVEGLDFEKIDQLIRQYHLKKTALLFICDMFALDALEHFKQNNISVPGHVGIMGFDNVSTLKYVTPRIATVSYEVETMAKKSFELLVKMLNGQAVPMELRLAYKIIEGTSL